MEDLTPLGRLLEAARKRRGLSQNKAAQAAGVSGTHWRRIIKGVASYGGTDVPYVGTADTVARMARAVDVSAEELAGVDREDAAEELRALTSGPGRRELPEIEVRADADPRILSILQNEVLTDEEKAWVIEALPPRREPRQESDTG